MNKIKTRTVPGDFKLSLKLAIWFTLLLWLIWLTSNLLGVELWNFGIFPGNTETLYGVLTAPLVHGSLAHLTANTLPLLVMLTILFFITAPIATSAIARAAYICGSGNVDVLEHNDMADPRFQGEDPLATHER